MLFDNPVFLPGMFQGTWVGVNPLCGGHHFPFSQIQDNPLDIEGHRSAEMTPAFLENRRESCLPGAMIFSGDSKVLLDLVSDFRNRFVSFYIPSPMPFMLRNSRLLFTQYPLSA